MYILNIAKVTKMMSVNDVSDLNCYKISYSRTSKNFAKIIQD